MQSAALGALLLAAALQDRPAPPTRPPALLVQIADERPSEPLAIEKMDVRVAITAFLAETTTTLTFRSQYERPLEGELVFPLPEGSTLSGYALDIGGELVDGVVVERHAARIAFEKEVRKGIDPGLAEWVKGNNFRTRVWPIPARGARTVRVRYVSALATRNAGSGLEATYLLPLVRQELPEFSLRIELAKAPSHPEVRSGGIANFRFDRWQDRLVAETRLTKFAATEDLLVALPQVHRENVLVERAEDGRSYFAIDDFPDLPNASTSRPAKRVGLYWDATLSRDTADRGRELGVIEAWLRRVGDVELDVVVFRNTAEPPRPFTIRGGDARALLAFLDGVPCDGATQLGSLVFAAGHDYDLLVSDGLDSLGTGVPRTRAAVYVLNGDARANHALLDHLARTSGGAYLNLQQATPDDAARAIGAAPFSLLSIEYDRSQIADVSPAGAFPLSGRGRATLSGRLLVLQARITLRYGIGSATQSRSYVVRESEAGSGRLVSGFWAQQRVAELGVFPDRNHDELLALGRAFGIVTPGTSLLVLETVEQHLAHGIEPPPSRAQLRAEYRQQVEEDQRAKRTDREVKIARVLEMWQRRLAWWQKTFPYPAGFRFKEATSKMEAGVRAGGLGVPRDVTEAVAGGAARPAPPAPPPPRPGGFEESITVTAQAPDVQMTSSAMTQAISVEEVQPPGAGPTILILPWDPDTPYLRALKQSLPGDAYRKFLVERRTYGRSPAFFLDCADYFLGAGQRAIGIRILTDIVELRLEEPGLLRIAAHRLQQIGEIDTAISIFEAVLRLRPEEPQSLRDLAGALSQRAEVRRQGTAASPSGVVADYQRALDLLNGIIVGEWDERFPEIEVIAIEEANRVIAALDRQGLAGAVNVPIDSRLRDKLEADLRVVLTWDTDLADMDLWVLEPSGEQCLYSHPLTTTGGMISKDFTRGYGPEEYLVRRAMPGVYKIQVNFFGSDSQQLTGPTTLQATVITDFGRDTEERRSLTVRLTTDKEVIDVGEIRIRGK